MHEEKPQEYISYNGLGRSPMIWGVPFMTGLMLMVVCLLGGMLLAALISPVGWLFALVGLPLFFFIRMMCATDDRAIDILLIEMKWAILNKLGGNAKYFGCPTTSPISYGRKLKHVKQYFKQANGR